MITICFALSKKKRSENRSSMETMPCPHLTSARSAPSALSEVLTFAHLSNKVKCLNLAGDDDIDVSVFFVDLTIDGQM